MFRMRIGQYTISMQSNGLPSLFEEYSKSACIVEHVKSSDSFCAPYFLSVQKNNQQPLIVITQISNLVSYACFHPGIILVPETNILFFGAGECLLAYDLTEPKRIWEDTADTGLWGWDRYGDIVIMSAELECAAWDIKGKKLWTTFVEPPWSYSFSGDTLWLDVMGKKTSFPLKEGPIK